MEFEAYGPIDRHFHVLPYTPAPISSPKLEAAPEVQSFQIKGWHFAVAVGILGVAGFVVWKVRRSKNKKDS